MPQFDKDTPTAFNNNTVEKQREISRLGGIASGEAKRRKKTMREELEIMLENIIKDKAGNDTTMQNAITSALLMKANKGDVRAYEVIRDTIGEKPVEKQEIVAKITPTQADEFESLVKSMME